MQWWEPLGHSGEVEVLDRVDGPVKHRVIETGDGGPLESATIALPGATVAVRFDEGVCEAVDGEAAVVALRLGSGAPHRLEGSLLGEELSIRRDADKSHGSLVRGPLMYWALSAGEHSWVWHYEDCSNANDWILSAGSRPGGEPLVVSRWRGATAQEREEQMAKRHLVGQYDAGARPIDVLLAELIDIASLGGVVRTRLIRGTYAAMDLGMWWFKDQPL